MATKRRIKRGVRHLGQMEHSGESDSQLREKRAVFSHARAYRGVHTSKRGRMTTRTRRETIHFRHPFWIKGIDRLLPSGGYEVVTDEELIEGLSFPAFRRVTTMIMVPAAPPHQTSTEMISISSVELSNAQRDDASAPL
jgi:hypothetical protein